MSRSMTETRPKFDEYSEKYADRIHMERRDGVIELRMHTDGGPVVWGLEMHRALSQAWHDVGNDPANEVMILTSTDPYWIGVVDEDEEQELPFDYDNYYREATKLVENLVFEVDIPTIAAVNGPGYHTELALLCDITICCEEAVFQDGHFLIGFVPGDGQLLTFQELIGVKRSSYALYTGQKIDARTALEWGLVNEVVPRGQLLDRARELAAIILKQPRSTRCLTHHLLVRPWKQRLINDFQAHITHEGFGVHVSSPKHELNAVRDSWKKK
ncbi:MAG: enoyl-CoA hydratase/isomerase family protein [Woeseiaceae bacterium]